MCARSLWLLFLVPLCWADNPTDTLCEPGLDRCYKFVNNTVDFLFAEATCVELGGHLVSIRNSYEKALVEQTAKTMFVGQSHYWIGLNRIHSEDVWSWTDGSTWKNSNRGPGGRSTERAVHVSLENGYWSATAETQLKPFVCAIPTPAAPSPKRALCDDDWIHFGYSKSCYQVIHNLKFEAAERKCVEKGGHLASVHSKLENDFIAGIARVGYMTNYHGMTWIGLHKVDDVWQWTDGTSTGYTHWAENEPNNYRGYGEMCVEMFTDTKYFSKNLPPSYIWRWNDYPCDQILRGAVCKKPELQ